MSKKPDALERFASFKQTFAYWALRLRHDLSFLIEDGIRRSPDVKTQKELSNRSGLRESYISRLVHGEKTCTLATVARVLHPLGIYPTLVDRAELEELRRKAARAENVDTVFEATLSLKVVDVRGTGDFWHVRRGFRHERHPARYTTAEWSS